MVMMIKMIIFIMYSLTYRGFLKQYYGIKMLGCHWASKPGPTCLRVLAHSLSAKNPSNRPWLLGYVKLTSAPPPPPSYFIYGGQQVLLG